MMNVREIYILLLLPRFLDVRTYGYPMVPVVGCCYSLY